MQDIHTIGGGGARFFGGGGGDRRLRPNNQHNIQALKCPRCESINTKFCYYNNYNLSQPRHFCKSCRRYWTKGGVLRNVPVGGGCRKSKRSKPKSNTTTTTTASADVVDGSEEPKSNSHSSSESSSLTATTTAAAATNNTGTGTTSSTAAAAEVVSASSSNVSSSMFLNFSESNFFVPNSTNNTFDHHHNHHQPALIDHTTEGEMFQDIGNFTSLIPPSNDPRSFNMAEIPGWNHQESKMDMETDHVKMEQMNNGSGFMSQTSRVELSGLQQNKVNNNSELCSSLDWQIGGGGEHGFYDLTGTVDQTYWSQTQWGENDQSLNFLP